MTVPVIFTWDGESMIPLSRFAKLCDQQFIVHEHYKMESIEARSVDSHSHYFACINEAWLNLPESVADQFPTSEHLRKWALIKAGFCDERSIVCASKAEAQRVAAFIKPMDTYAVVIAREATIKAFTAQSQSMRAMGKKDFQASKQAVFDILSGMIGVETKKLQAQPVANKSDEAKQKVGAV